ncbi:hypothetical protein RMSM_07554 [Rhodopirellula maiorica SM1]|uniref:Uncharacterized protein n=1 Tax=Rhodopirellula maiorica SM1 TaxID=1265738 RepID=M5R906_9BACT|nr:hypothetical protein RMSM_07554 [Rhodopirellula maiorica SM1]
MNRADSGTCIGAPHELQVKLSNISLPLIAIACIVFREISPQVSVSLQTFSLHL